MKELLKKSIMPLLFTGIVGYATYFVGKASFNLSKEIYASMTLDESKYPITEYLEMKKLEEYLSYAAKYSLNYDPGATSLIGEDREPHEPNLEEAKECLQYTIDGLNKLYQTSKFVDAKWKNRTGGELLGLENILDEDIRKSQDDSIDNSIDDRFVWYGRLMDEFIAQSKILDDKSEEYARMMPEGYANINKSGGTLILINMSGYLATGFLGIFGAIIGSEIPYNIKEYKKRKNQKRIK